MKNLPISQEYDDRMVNSLYLRLATDETLWSEDLNSALRKVTETLSKALKVCRVSIWITQEQDSLILENLFDNESNTHSKGIELQRTQYPKYFAAVDQERIIDAPDARTNSHTAEFLKPYLAPLNIHSMLDATLRAGGKVFGVLCIEQTMQQRHWSDQEKYIAQTMSDLVSQVFVYHDLIQQASYDPLTNLPNRKSLADEINKSLESYNQHRIKFSFLLIDLDRFKEINDTLGHDYGDRLLKSIAPKINQSLSNEDTFLSRLGGDEFALLIRNKSGQRNVQKIAQTITDSLNEPFSVDGIALQIAASIGMVANAHELKNKQNILRCADIAMYHAKSKGENYAFYSNLIDKHSKEKLALMSDLWSAISKQEFVIHYQPKLDLLSNRVAGFEGLARWQNPDKGLIFPSEFVELIEMSDLVHPFTDQILQMGIQQISKWATKGIDLPVSINISARNLLEYDFPLKIERWLDLYNVPASKLELEITERALITDPMRALQIVKKISLLGVRIAIDDFGTGYSSLSYLKQLSINMLKIDKSFVLEMKSSKHDEIIVRSTISLAHNLGLSVVAEGVETREAQEMLAAMNCDFAQGYAISYPLPAKEIEEYMEKEMAELNK